MAPAYQYLPLNASQIEVLLVVLVPSHSFAAQVSCRLVHRSLDSGTAFEALSYTWGDANRRRLIFLNGLDFSVTKNLDIALRHLRYRDDERYIWIDAICINQDDIPERNQQVTKMHEIYSKAAKVVAWLGPASSNSDMAFIFLAEAALKYLEIDDWLPKAWKDRGLTKQWRAVCDIISRDYWRRVWITQEIFFAGSLIVRCGFRCMRWSDFIFLLYKINFEPELITLPISQNPLQTIAGNAENILTLPIIAEKCELPASIEKWRMASCFGVALPLENLLVSHRNSLSTDPRDKVYAMAGMAWQFNGQHALKIDYSRSKRETYIETARYLMEKRKDSASGPLDVMGITSPAFSDGSLPSWVPDWSSDWSPPSEPKRQTGLGGMSFFYNANGASPPDPVFEIEDDVLIVQGLKIATIDHFGAAPVPLPLSPLFGNGGVNYMAKMAGKMDGSLKAFYAAAKLAMSDSEHMPHSHKALDVRWREFTRTLLCNHNMPTLDGVFDVPSEETLREFCEVIMTFDKSNNNWGRVSMQSRGASNALLLTVVDENLRQYRFCVSSTGLFLMAPPSSRIGDIVCVLFGCNMPVVLREMEGGHYIFVGECYADGIMDGEAMKDLADGKNTVVEFRIH